MKQKTIAFLLALTMLLSAFTVALAEDETTPVILGGGLKSYQIISADGLDPADLTLNQIPYQPQLNANGDIMLSTSDLLCADAAQRLIGEGVLGVADVSIGRGKLMVSSDSVITMEDVDAFLDLVKKYRVSRIPAAAREFLDGLLKDIYAAQTKSMRGEPEAADALYLRAIKVAIEKFSLMYTLKGDSIMLEALRDMENDPELNSLLDKFTKYVDKGICHDYTPSPTTSFGPQGERYTLASGGGTMVKNLEIIKMFQSPITIESNYRCPGCGDLVCTCNPLPAAVPEVNDNPSSGVDEPRPIG